MSASGELPRPVSSDPATQATELMSQVDPPSAVAPPQAAGPAAVAVPAAVAFAAAAVVPAAAIGLAALAQTEAVPLPLVTPSRSTVARARAQAAWKALASRLERLPRAARGLLSAALLVGIGFGLGQLLSGGERTPEEQLRHWAQRIAAPEGELVRSALSLNDPLSALAALRAAAAKERLRADPAALVVRARLAVGAREPSDALDSLELAVTEHPSLVKEPWVVETIIRTFNAGRPARTGLLLAKVDRPTSVRLLRTASTDDAWRVRHGAADALKALGEAIPDQVGFLILDAWQTDRCDVQRAAVSKLRAPALSDDRIPPALEALARRPGLPGCIDDLVPRAPR